VLVEVIGFMKNQTTKQSILVVDDYDDIRELMKARLEQQGYLVLEAADGSEAVEMAEREHPNLILMDFNLPILDGFVAARYIRELEGMQDVPIIGLTAHGKEYSQSLAVASGCNDYLEKPVDFDHLDVVIQRWLSKAEPQA
jgi:CheY-like chemotaxis protein